MSIDYEKSFNKLVEQINKEYGWALMSDIDTDDPNKKGMLFAYGSIKRLADKLKKGEFIFDEESEEERFNY